jgi:hypothetical protein
VIFVGSPKFNSHLKDFPSKRDFVIEGGVIKNLRPRSGEREEYRTEAGPRVDDPLRWYPSAASAPGQPQLWPAGLG